MPLLVAVQRAAKRSHSIINHHPSSIINLHEFVFLGQLLSYTIVTRCWVIDVTQAFLLLSPRVA